MNACDDNYRAQAEALVARHIIQTTTDGPRLPHDQGIVDSIADALRAAAEQAESDEDETCAKIAENFALGREAAAADAQRANDHDTWCQYKGEAGACLDVACAIRRRAIHRRVPERHE